MLFIFCWYLCGCLIYGKILYNVIHTITIGDIIMTLLAGLVGPANAVFYILEEMERRQFKIKWMHRQVWTK